MASIEWPEGMDERMRALVSLDLQRNAILLSAIESSVQTVREDVQQSQAANMKMFNALRDDFTDLRTEVKVIDQKVDDLTTETRTGFQEINSKFSALDTKVASLDTSVASLDTSVTSLDTKVTSLDTRFTSLERRVDALDAKLDTRVDALEAKVDLILTKLG